MPTFDGRGGDEALPRLLLFSFCRLRRVYLPDAPDTMTDSRHPLSKRTALSSLIRVVEIQKQRYLRERMGLPSGIVIDL